MSVFLLMSWVWPLTEVLAADLVFETHGDFSSAFSFSQKPSSVKDQTAFSNPSGLFQISADPVQDIKALTELSYGRTFDSATGRATLQVEKAYIKLGAILGESEMLIGQLPNPWVEMHEREEPFWFYLGTAYRTASLRWDELYRSDSGMAVVSSWSNSHLQLSLSNGEGPGQPERGPRKDAQLHFETMPIESLRGEKKLLLALGILEGAFENIDSEIAQRERLLAFVKYQSNAWGSLSIEGLWSKDPADGINGVVGDQVDLTAQGGQSVRGRGTAVALNTKLSETSLMSLRYEALNPALGVDAKGLSSRMLGFHFFPRQMLQFSLAWLDVQYEQNHGVAIRDSSEVVFGARLRWP